MLRSFQEGVKPAAPWTVALSMLFNCEMVRPCFLIVDREFPGTISTRKLVMETAKYNVITAYSGTEAVHTFEQFPGITGIVLNADMRDTPCGEVARQLKAIRSDIPIVSILSPGAEQCPGADYHLESFDPKQLLALLQKLTPLETAEILAREQKLERDTPGV